MKTIIVSDRAAYTDLCLIIQGSARYYLRAYSDGTFDVHGRQRPGEITAITSVGLDGAVKDDDLENRLRWWRHEHGKREAI